MKSASLLLSTIFLSVSFSGLPAGQSSGSEDPVTVSITASPDTITVGGRFQLIVETAYHKDIVVQMPAADIELGALELLDHQYAPLSEDENGNILARSVYTLTAFKTGEFTVPSITLSYRTTSSGEEETVKTKPVVVNVVSVLTDDETDIKDIKPPLEIPRDWLPLIAAFVLGGALMTIALLLWRKRRRAAQQGLESVPKLPPHIEALRELNGLANSGLLDRGEIVQFHVQVSEIIRQYFARRFEIDALEKTTEELVASLPQDVPLTHPRNLLSQCDLVKFAKFQPTRSNCEKVLELAFEIVEMTKPRLESPPVSETARSFDRDSAEVESVGGN